MSTLGSGYIITWQGCKTKYTITSQGELVVISEEGIFVHTLDEEDVLHIRKDSD